MAQRHDRFRPNDVAGLVGMTFLMFMLGTNSGRLLVRTIG